MLCAKIVEIGPMVLEKKILKFINVISLFSNYLPLEKGVALYLNKLESPSRKDTLCRVEIGRVILKKKKKMRKFTNNDDDNNDGQRINLIRKAHLSIWLR